MDLTLTPTWGGVFRVEDTTPLLGHNAANGALPFGVDGPDNQQAKDLGNRTEYLRGRIESLLVRTVTPLTTHDLTALAAARRGLRVVAGVDYSGANVTTIDVPKGQWLIVNECRWPLTIRGPSGVGRTVVARVAPASSVAEVYADELDTTVLGSGTSAMRDVDAVSALPANVPSGGTTVVTVTGKGFLGAIDVQVAVNSCPFVVLDDTTLEVTVDGPAIGAVPGPADIQVIRTGGEQDFLSPAFTFT